MSRLSGRMHSTVLACQACLAWLARLACQSMPLCSGHLHLLLGSHLGLNSRGPSEREKLCPDPRSASCGFPPPGELTLVCPTPFFVFGGLRQRQNCLSVFISTRHTSWRLCWGWSRGSCLNQSKQLRDQSSACAGEVVARLSQIECRRLDPKKPESSVSRTLARLGTQGVKVL